MISVLRRRLTYANVAMTLALVFAMSGGAYAAGKYLITSTKQISPKVLKSLQGKAGPAGAIGATGATGAAGPAGSAGPAGPQGPKGETGATGTNGAAGKNGENGKEGSPWTAGGTLPAKATETGTWDVTTANVEREKDEASAAISFPIPLKEPLDEEHVHYVGTEGGTQQCPGTAAEPKATAGNLCVYQSKRCEGVVVTSEDEGKLASASIRDPGELEFVVVPVPGAGRAGAVLVLEKSTQIGGENGNEVDQLNASCWGMWAVTASAGTS